MKRVTRRRLIVADIDNTDFFYGLLFDDPITLSVDSDEEQASNELGPVGVIHTTPILSLQEILTGLAQAVNGNKISKFNITRNDIWEGTKWGLKSFSPCKKMLIRFSDVSGKSKGAVDLGGPTREFLTLVLEWLANSHLFCGPKQAKFLSCNASGLASSEYLYAGKMAALSLVHGGPGPSFFSPSLYDALVKDPDKVEVTLEEVYDPELKSSLQDLTKAQSVQEACAFIEHKNLDIIFEFAGTLQQLKSVADIGKIVQQTAHWYILGRAWPALEQFKQGLSDLGVLEAVISSPEVFTLVFCYVPVDLTADMFCDIITVCCSEEGSNKRTTESVVVSYWHDYLQDAEEGEVTIALSDVLFFTSGCKQLPPLRLGWEFISLEFVHYADTDGNLSPYPMANTCGPVLSLPVIHKSYKS